MSLWLSFEEEEEGGEDLHLNPHLHLHSSCPQLNGLVETNTLFLESEDEEGTEGEVSTKVEEVEGEGEEGQDTREKEIEIVERDGSQLVPLKDEDEADEEDEVEIEYDETPTSSIGQDSEVSWDLEAESKVEVESLEADYHRASDCTDIVRLKVVLKRQPSLLQYVDEEGNTLLHWMAVRDQPLLLKVLLKRKKGNMKSLLDQQNRRGCTALWFAAQLGYDRPVRVLLELGANRQLKGCLEEGGVAIEPSEAATREGHQEIVDMLKQ